MDLATDGQALFTNRGCIHIGAASFVPETRKLGTSNNLLFRRDWLECGGKRILWLPREYRSNASAVYGKLLAIGSSSGLVTFWDIQYP